MTYDNTTCNDFVEEMQTAGYEVEHYRGRAFWEGPSVRVEDRSGLVHAIRATSMDVQWDSMGWGYIIFPVRSGELVKAD